MKYIIENKSKSKDRDILDIISKNIDYIDFSKDIKMNIKTMCIKVSCKKNIVNIIVEDMEA